MCNKIWPGRRFLEKYSNRIYYTFKIKVSIRVKIHIFEFLLIISVKQCQCMSCKASPGISVLNICRVFFFFKKHLLKNKNRSKAVCPLFPDGIKGALWDYS